MACGCWDAASSTTARVASTAWRTTTSTRCFKTARAPTSGATSLRRTTAPSIRPSTSSEDCAAIVRGLSTCSARFCRSAFTTKRSIGRNGGFHSLSGRCGRWQVWAQSTPSCPDAGLPRLTTFATCWSSERDRPDCRLRSRRPNPALAVVVVDENARAGGSLHYQWAGQRAGSETLRSLLDSAAKLPKLEVRTATLAAGHYADHWIALVDERRLVKMRARSVVHATGCCEQPAVFGNNDLPGVMLATAAQRLLHQYSVRPFDRGVVLAANDDGYRAALDVARAGVTVAAIVDLRAESEIGPFADEARRASIRVYAAHAITPGRRRLWQDFDPRRVGGAVGFARTTATGKGVRVRSRRPGDERGLGAGRWVVLSGRRPDGVVREFAAIRAEVGAAGLVRRRARERSAMPSTTSWPTVAEPAWPLPRTWGSRRHNCPPSRAGPR